MMQQLSALACFDHVEAIKPIVAGLSSQCFQVNADNKQYFAKQSPTDNEVIVGKLAATYKISPKVLYHDQLWLICEFIDGDNLANLSEDEKITAAIKLMTQCHQINLESTKVTELNPQQITKTLIEQSHFANKKKVALAQLANSLLSQLPNASNQVVCHGDINFSNILISPKNKAWLVDFECTCIAPREYDLAMFIAVNNIDENKISTIISQYQRLSLPIKIELKLLYSYLAFSYFINSLWYAHAYQNSNDTTFINLQKQQWQQYISLVANK